jgi:hypothetical protein
VGGGQVEGAGGRRCKGSVGDAKRAQRLGRRRCSTTSGRRSAGLGRPQRRWYRLWSRRSPPENRGSGPRPPTASRKSAGCSDSAPRPDRGTGQPGRRDPTGEGRGAGGYRACGVRSGARVRGVADQPGCGRPLDGLPRPRGDRPEGGQAAPALAKATDDEHPDVREIARTAAKKVRAKRWCRFGVSSARAKTRYAIARTDCPLALLRVSQCIGPLGHT